LYGNIEEPTERAVSVQRGLRQSALGRYAEVRESTCGWIAVTKSIPGPRYRSDEIFDLSGMQPYSLETLHSELSAYTEHMVLYLPRTSDLRQLASLVKDGRKALVIHYCMEGASKALCIYNGDFKN